MVLLGDVIGVFKYVFEIRLFLFLVCVVVFCWIVELVVLFVFFEGDGGGEG